VGHRCVGAKVDGRMVPLDTHLQNGDIVEIITNKSSAGPSWDWLKICKTSSAKHKIRLWLKKEKREENIIRGKELLEKFLARIRSDPTYQNVSKETLIDQMAIKSSVMLLLEREFLFIKIFAPISRRCKEILPSVLLK